jgi:diguanylate cyclase (GGDEF)-like protein/hemerythrin-like metal-binding protein/PAS domain S-box-containing protein
VHLLKFRIAGLRNLRHNLSTPSRYVIATGVYCVALLAREVLFSLGSGDPYVTFYPAVVVTLYICGRQPGALVAILSAATGFYISTLPYRPAIAGHESLLGAATFLAAAFLIGALVNELQEALEQLRTATLRGAESERLYRSLLDDQSDTICRFRSDGPIIYVNDAYCRFFGKSRADLVGQAWHPEAWHEDLPLFEDKLGSLSAANPVVTIESRVATADGSVVWREFLNRAFFDESGRITQIQSVGRDINERKSADARIGFLANHDQLTELPNRGLFYDRLSQAISRARRNSEHVAVFLIDLDDFKPINDRYGHEAGDDTLKEVARRLLECVRNMDTVARLGGDEFGIVLVGMGNVADMRIFAEKVLAALSAPLVLKNRAQARVGASLGISTYPQCGREIDKLMNAADRAMYESKSRGKNTLTFAPAAAGAQVPDAPAIFLDTDHLVGAPMIDRQHQAIANLLNEFNHAVQDSAGQEIVIARFDEMIAVSGAHFRSEERLMTAQNYPESRAHAMSHQQLLEMARHLRARLADGGEMLALQALKDWFLPHILNFDKPLADYLAQRTTAVRRKTAARPELNAPGGPA